MKVTVQHLGDARMPLHNGRLLLAPDDPRHAIAVDTLQSRLSAADFIGTALEDASAATPASGRCFRIGSRFFDYVGFTGCAVNLGSGDDDRPSCHICLPPPSPRPRFFHGRNTRPPRCLACRQTHGEWRQILLRQCAESRSSGLTAEQRGALGAMDDYPPLLCTACHRDAPAWDWDWRRTGGFARSVIVIEDVFPGEAAPLRSLLGFLEEASGGLAWQWFGVQD